MKIYHATQTKFNQLVQENVHDHQPADKAYLNDIKVTNISKSFTHKMAAETSWHRYGTKLRHCHSMYTRSINASDENVVQVRRYKTQPRE